MDLLDFVDNTIILIMELSMPSLVVATVVGLIVSIFQALTQIQEQTLPQVAKIVAVALLILIGSSASGQVFADFMDLIFETIPRI